MSTIRDAGISGDFVHEPLSDPQVQIRLVQIDLSGDKDNEIHCTISAYPLGAPPPYVAISYTWGDKSMKQSIWVNKRRLNIGHNSWLALWQARSHCVRPPLRVWIDVLSIDQANDIEKSIQVGLMGAIYEAAKYVLASVGAHEDDSEYLGEQVQATAEHLHAWRLIESRKEDPPVEFIKCPFCIDFSVCSSSRASDEIRKVPTLDLYYCLQTKHCDRCRRRLYILWYEHRGSKICRACDPLNGNNVDAERDWVLTDNWGAIDKPPERRFGRAAESRFTWSRLLEMPEESQQRLVNAFSTFSYRQYFSRLWVVREIKFNRNVLVVCGDSILTFDALWILAWDLDKNPDYREKRGIVAYSKHLQGLLDYDGTISERGPGCLWKLAVDHHNYHCADTRDRVFALLSMSHDDSSIRPDYTKSALQVLLQLLKEKLNRLPDDSLMRSMSSIVSGFHLGPLSAEIADVLQLRRSAHETPFRVPRTLTFDHYHPPKILLGSDLCCKVWKDEDSNLVTSLLKEVPPSTKACDHEFHDLWDLEQYAKNVAVRVKNPLGRVVALVDKKVGADDVLVFFRDQDRASDFRYAQAGPTSLSPPAAGLVVRPLIRDLHVIVGQVVVGPGIRPERHDESPDRDSTGTDSLGLELGHNGWWVYMSPGDLLLFIAQDMKSEVSSPGKDFDSPITRTFCPEETAKRLTTNVTISLNSSYALLKQRHGLSPQGGPPVVLDRIR